MLLTKRKHKCAYCRASIDFSAKKCPECNEWVDGKYNSQELAENTLSAAKRENVVSWFSIGVSAFTLLLLGFSIYVTISINNEIKGDEIVLENFSKVNLYCYDSSLQICRDNKICGFISFYLTIINSYRKPIVINGGQLKVFFEKSNLEIPGKVTGLHIYNFGTATKIFGENRDSLYTYIEKSFPKLRADGSTELTTTTVNPFSTGASDRIRKFSLKLEPGRNVLYYELQINPNNFYIKGDTLSNLIDQHKTGYEEPLHVFNEVSIVNEFTLILTPSLLGWIMPRLPIRVFEGESKQVPVYCIKYSDLK